MEYFVVDIASFLNKKNYQRHFYNNINTNINLFVLVRKYMYGFEMSLDLILSFSALLLKRDLALRYSLLWSIKNENM